ncbi:MAG TPA: HPP family protein [Planctomycetes bacterium]|nr:HPP family protein [Planctomycetota bacterium]
MATSNKHVFAARWTRLAADVEQAFFRIERQDRWLASAINGAIAGASVALVAWLVTTKDEGDMLLFACLGSSAASVVFAPVAKSNSLRTIICAYVIASLTCFVLFPMRDFAYIPVQCFLAVALPVTFMRWMDSMHPAAIGASLAFIIYDRDVKLIILLLLAILGLLTIVKVLAYIYLEELKFKDFGREFRREYYGQEMTITVKNSPD